MLLMVSAAAQPIDSLEDVMVGGVRQKILLQGDDTANPILLWLHGGPGEPAMMVSHRYSAQLRKSVVLVHWDQRGGGLSYDPQNPPTGVSEQRIEQDTVEITNLLLRRFHRNKLYLLGHSFGSVIGLRVAAEHPEPFCAYIGMGQVLNDGQSRELARAWLEAEYRKSNNTAGLARLDDPSMLDRLVREQGGSLHQPIDYNGLIKASPYYFDGYLQQKNAARGLVVDQIGRNSPARTGLDTLLKLAVPAFFFEGRYDHVPASSPELVVRYVQRLQAPHKEIVWFENSGHQPNLEEPEHFQEMIRDKVLRATPRCGR